MSSFTLRHPAGRSWVLAWFALAAMFTARAQELPAPLTKVKEVLDLPAATAAEGKTAVRLRGVITDVATKQDEISLHDGSGNISATLLEGMIAPELGTEVEVEGRVYSESFNEQPRTRV
jgi:hypothetical protein